MTPDSTLPDRLQHPDPAARRAEVDERAAQARARPDLLPPTGTDVNLHCHSFYSFNHLGWSPSRLAWELRRRGLAAGGLVDFDVLDGVEEFLAAADAFGLRAVASLESRVFVPEFRDRVLNSPGEPGVAYHMGVGFVAGRVPAAQAAFLQRLRAIPAARNRALVAAVNAVLDPVRLDYDADVLPLTPAGNVTERHITLAYCRQARARFPDPAGLAAFWSRTLSCDAAALDLPEGPKLQNRLRAATMKQGGPGYQAPTETTFPTLAEFNRFAIECGAIPTVAWLDGASAGEQALDEWFDTAAASGACALNVIPDRNVTPGVRDRKLEALEAVLDAARRRHWPVLAGTEMNAPGNKFVDDFASAELRPHVPLFLESAWLLHAHTRLQAAAGMGWLSPWAERQLPERAARNRFFVELGRRLGAGQPLPATPNLAPAQLLARVESP